MAAKEKIPKESEKIAARRTARFAEKIIEARRGLGGNQAWWSNWLTEFLGLLGLFALNFYLVYPLFGRPAHETTFSGPVIPLFARGVEFLGAPMAHAYQIVNLVFFLGLPLSFYLFVKRVASRKIVAFLSALFLSLPFYPFAQVRAQSAFLTVESPHIASLAIIPLALYGLLSFLREGGLKSLAIASFSSALVALTSPFGFVTYSLFAGLTAFSEMLLGRGRLKLFRVVVVFLFAAGLTSFWYNPGFSFWMATGPLGEEVRQTVGKLLPVSFFLVPVLGALGFLLFDRKPGLQSVFLASFYTTVFAVIVLLGGLFPSNPSRYTPELGISLAFFLGVGIARGTDYLRFQKRLKLSWLSGNALANTLLFLIFLALIVGIIWGRDRIVGRPEDVLGLWTDVSRGRIWVARDQFSGVFSYLGYAIAGLSLLSLGFLGMTPRRPSNRTK